MLGTPTQNDSVIKSFKRSDSSDSVLWKETLCPSPLLVSDTINPGLGVTRWAGFQRWKVNSQADRQMEESDQHLKDEKGMKDGPSLVLWQSGIWMRLHTNVTEIGVLQLQTISFICCLSEHYFSPLWKKWHTDRTNPIHYIRIKHKCETWT